MSILSLVGTRSFEEALEYVKLLRQVHYMETGEVMPFRDAKKLWHGYITGECYRWLDNERRLK